MLGFKDCRRIGRIGKPHGHSGELKLELLAETSIDLNLNEPVFLLIEGKPVPFFMLELNEQAQPPILKFEDCDSLHAARALQGADVFANAALVEADFWSEESLVGFELHHPESGKIGEIQAIVPSGLQELIQVKNEKGEFLLPIQEEIIDWIDQEAKSICLNFPLELLELDS